MGDTDRERYFAIVAHWQSVLTCCQNGAGSIPVGKNTRRSQLLFTHFFRSNNTLSKFYFQPRGRSSTAEWGIVCPQVTGSNPVAPASGSEMQGYFG